MEFIGSFEICIWCKYIMRFNASDEINVRYHRTSAKEKSVKEWKT
jgi:hypothetical protein